MNVVSPDTTEVIIVDDLIVFGDTVESVYENVYCLTKIKAKIVAMAASQRFHNSLRSKNVVYPNLDDASCPDILPDFLIPAYTARNSWDIISMRHSIDLEHTILRVNIDSHMVQEKIADKLRDALSNVFPEESVYIVTHTIPFSHKKTYSVSVVFHKNGENIINNDFSKLRFFISDSEIRIVSYAPNIWDIPLMEVNSLRFNTERLSNIWLTLRDTLTSVSISEDSESKTEFDDKFILGELMSRVELSGVVMANYLVSFDNICVKKNKLSKVFELAFGTKPQFEINREDLDLIIGTKLSNEIVPELENAFENATSEVSVIMRTMLSQEDISTPLIPQLEMDNYKEERILDVFMTANVYSALSLIFNRLSVKFGLIDVRREDRIKVGETFSSLLNILSNRYTQDDLVEYVHRWIDSRIDLGVVVPKYEYTIGSLGFRIWRRYFRAGEREDTMMGIARAATIIGSNKFKGQDKITESEFMQEVSAEMCLLNELSEGQIDTEIFSQGLFANVDEKFRTPEYGLWLYMVRLGIINLYDLRNLSEGKLVKNDDGSPIFKSTDIYDSPE